MAVSKVWRRSFGTFSVTSPALVCVVAGPRVATGLRAFVTLRIAQPVRLGVQQRVQRLLDRAKNHPVQVPPDPLVVDRDDIRKRNRLILVSHGGFVPLFRLI